MKQIGKVLNFAGIFAVAAVETLMKILSDENAIKNNDTIFMVEEKVFERVGGKMFFLN